MNMPNRKDEVDAIVALHKGLFKGGEDGRRQLLLWICAGLNLSDDGQWGILLKPGGIIPADCIVWRDTLEHVDCLTDTGTTWINHGKIQPAWTWMAAPPPGTPLPALKPPPAPSSGRPYDESFAVEFGQGVNRANIDYINAHGQGMPYDPGMIAVHAHRNAFDYFVGMLDRQPCLVKHLNEYRAEYGLPPLA